jgi:hypothetical protein
MKLLVRVAIFLGVTLWAAFARAACPEPFPEKPTPDDLRSCFAEIAKLRSDIQSLQTSRAVETPVGAVIAFDGPCPASPQWKPFTPAIDRFVIGAGTPPPESPYGKWKRELQSGGFEEIVLTTRHVGDSGGEESHILTVSQMPSHSHAFTAVQYGGGCAFSGCSATAQFRCDQYPAHRRQPTPQSSAAVPSFDILRTRKRTLIVLLRIRPLGSPVLVRAI